MNYIKVFEVISLRDAEETINPFLKDLAEKGHRVMGTYYKSHGTWMSAVFPINDEPHPHKKV
jgi:hypothetical protein